LFTVSAVFSQYPRFCSRYSWFVRGIRGLFAGFAVCSRDPRFLRGIRGLFTVFFCGIVSLLGNTFSIRVIRRNVKRAYEINSKFITWWNSFIRELRKKWSLCRKYETWCFPLTWVSRKEDKYSLNKVRAWYLLLCLCNMSRISPIQQ
jgi:hypothetical protein